MAALSEKTAQRRIVICVFILDWTHHKTSLTSFGNTDLKPSHSLGFFPYFMIYINTIEIAIPKIWCQ